MRLLWIVSIGKEAPTTVNRVLPLSRELACLGYEIDVMMASDHLRNLGKTWPIRTSLGPLWGYVQILHKKFLPRARKFIFPPVGLEDFSTFFHLLKKCYRSFKYDVIYATKPLLGSAGVGLLLAKRHDVPLILDLDDYDIHPDNHLLWNFQGIIVASLELKKLFKKYNPLYIPMSTDLELFNPLNYRSKKISPPIITWSGMMYEELKLEVILDAFKLVKENARLMFMGKGPKRQYLIDHARSLHLESKVVFSEWLEKANVPAHLAESSIGIVYLSNDLFSRCKCPGKMFEYMAMELPIITTDVGEAAYLVRKAGCGIVVPPDDPKALAEAMDYLLQNPSLRHEMGKRGREYLINKQNYKLLSLRLKKYIEQTVSSYSNFS